MLEQAQGAPIRCWLKIDTGMHRLGFAPEAAREAHARLRAARGVTGDIVLMSHFASSDEFEGVSSDGRQTRSEEHTSELQSLMRISYAVFCLKKKIKQTIHHDTIN